ncbi:hypothetical protein M569_13513, partial [Genlisea aurea]
QVFVELPYPGTSTLSIYLRNPSPDYTLRDLLSSLPPTVRLPPMSSLFFTMDRKIVSDSTPIFNGSPMPAFSTLRIDHRIRGGGGDGGATGAESRDCYLNMYADKKPDKVDPNEVRLSKWVNCSLSYEPLRHPIVMDELGNLFNKEALVEALLMKNMPKEFGYIRGLKDMIPVELAEIPGSKQKGSMRFQCPITGLECNGKSKFYAIKTCGHVLSAKGLKEVKSSGCLVCHKEFSDGDKVVVNGSEEEVKALWEKLKQKKKFGSNNKKHKIEGGGDGSNNKKSKLASSLVAPANATKEVYASIFTSSKKSDFKETFMCRSLPLGRN